MATASIRLATEQDIPAIQALVEASVRGLQTNDYSPTQIDASIGSAFGTDRQLIEDQTYFLGEIDGHAAVCGGWSYRKTLCGSDTLHDLHGAGSRNTTTMDPAIDRAKIRAIFVHPAQARQGLGTQILAHCEAAAQRAGFTRFEMGSTLTGVPLYQLRGYKVEEELTIPLPNGEPLEVIRMTKSL